MDGEETFKNWSTLYLCLYSILNFIIELLTTSTLPLIENLGSGFT